MGILVLPSGEMSLPPPEVATIGGNYPESRNVISGNAQAGIVLAFGDATFVNGNYADRPFAPTT